MPAEQDALIAIEIGENPRNDDAGEQLAFLVPSVSAASTNATSSFRVVLAMIRTCWNKVPMTMMVIFGPS